GRDGSFQEQTRLLTPPVAKYLQKACRTPTGRAVVEATPLRPREEFQMTVEATMDAAPESALHNPDNAARNRLVIAILLVSTFVVFLNETIMSVAIPHLMNDLGVSAGAAQWLTTAFLLTMAVVIP